MLRNSLIVLLTVGLTAMLARIVRCEMRQRRDSRQLDEDINTWEGEGGQVPGATPASSIPGTTVHSGPVAPSTLH